MEAIITGENSEAIGLHVVDNNGIKHKIEMEFDGEVYYHDQDGYPDDPDERTTTDKIHIGQARRFARYWVYRKRGYETVDRWDNPDRITLAALAVAPLTAETAERYFGDLYQQFKSIYTDATPTVEMPEGVTPEEAIYQKDIYVGVETSHLGHIMAEVLADAELLSTVSRSLDVTGQSSSEMDASSGLTEFFGMVTGSDPDEITGLEDGGLVEAVSGIHVEWEYEPGKYQTRQGEEPDLQRDPDGRSTIFEYNPASITDLKIQIVRNLLCQVRDRYLVMGIAPPEPFRLLGLGQIIPGTWYKNRDYYEPYHDPNATVSTWFEEYTPEDAYEHEAEPPQQ